MWQKHFRKCALRSLGDSQKRSPTKLCRTIIRNQLRIRRQAVLNSSTAQQPTKATATSRLWLVSNFDIWSLKLCAISTFSVYTHTHTHTHTHTCIQNMLKFADCFRLTLWLSFSLTFHQHISPPSNLPIHTHSHTHIMGHEYWSFACNAFQLFCNWNF